MDVRARSVDFLVAVRRIAEVELIHAGKGTPGGERSGAQDEAGDSDEGSAPDDDDGSVDMNGSSLAKDPAPITLSLDFAAVPKGPFSATFTFSSLLRLKEGVVKSRRDPGLLWIVIPAEKSVVRRRKTVV